MIFYGEHDINGRRQHYFVAITLHNGRVIRPGSPRLRYNGKPRIDIRGARFCQKTGHAYYCVHHQTTSRPVELLRVGKQYHTIIVLLPNLGNSNNKVKSLYLKNSRTLIALSNGPVGGLHPDVLQVYYAVAVADCRREPLSNTTHNIYGIFHTDSRREMCPICGSWLVMQTQFTTVYVVGRVTLSPHAPRRACTTPTPVREYKLHD